MIMDLLSQNIPEGNYNMKTLIQVLLVVITTTVASYSFGLYNDISSSVLDKYPFIALYLKLLAIWCILLFIFVGVLVLITAFTLFLFCCSCCCRDSWLRALNIPSLLMNMENSPNRPRSEETVNFVLSHLPRAAFQALIHTQTKECAICLADFAEGEEIIELPCDKKHYYHVECIQAWISGERKVTCPICRKDIAEEVEKLQQEERKTEMQEEAKTETEDARENFELVIEPNESAR